MIFAVCATQNLYKPLIGTVNMINRTQTDVEAIYCFVEHDETHFSDFADNVHFVNVHDFEKAKTTLNSDSGWTYMCLVRCFFCELLPNVDKVIYLDLDIVIKGDLHELWNMDMTDKSVAGVVDTGVYQLRRMITRTCPLYINSGVLLMNLKYMRDNKLDEAVIRMLDTYLLEYPDQDAINIALKDTIKIIDNKFNSSPATSISPNPVIIHTTGGIKPWHIESKHFGEFCGYYFRL